MGNVVYGWPRSRHPTYTYTESCDDYYVCLPLQKATTCLHFWVQSGVNRPKCPSPKQLACICNLLAVCFNVLIESWSQLRRHQLAAIRHEKVYTNYKLTSRLARYCDHRRLSFLGLCTTLACRSKHSSDNSKWRSSTDNMRTLHLQMSIGFSWTLGG